jgi:hypothetical protein
LPIGISFYTITAIGVLIFYRWRPEYRILLESSDEIYYWLPVNVEDEQHRLKEFLRRDDADEVKRIKARYQSWAQKNVCFIIPLTMSGESLLRGSFIPDTSTCREILPISCRLEQNPPK